MAGVTEPAVNMSELVMVFGLAVVQADGLFQFSTGAGEVVQLRHRFSQVKMRPRPPGPNLDVPAEIRQGIAEFGLPTVSMTGLQNRPPALKHVTTELNRFAVTFIIPCIR